MPGCLADVVQRVLAAGAERVAVTGPDGMGKTTFAAQSAEGLRRAGHVVLVVSADDFHNPRAVRHARWRRSAEGFYRDMTDLAGMRAALLEPLAEDGERRVRTRIFDHRRDIAVDVPYVVVAKGTIVILEGLFLIRSELCGAFDLTIYLDAPFAETFQRMAARDGVDPDPFAPESERFRAGQELWFAEEMPKARADLVIDMRDTAAPKLVAMRGAAC